MPWAACSRFKGGILKLHRLLQEYEPRCISLRSTHRVYHELILIIVTIKKNSNIVHRSFPIQFVNVFPELMDYSNALTAFCAVYIVRLIRCFAVFWIINGEKCPAIKWPVFVYSADVGYQERTICVGLCFSFFIFHYFVVRIFFNVAGLKRCHFNSYFAA